MEYNPANCRACVRTTDPKRGTLTINILGHPASQQCNLPADADAAACLVRVKEFLKQQMRLLPDQLTLISERACAHGHIAGVSFSIFGLMTGAYWIVTTPNGGVAADYQSGSKGSCQEDIREIDEFLGTLSFGSEQNEAATAAAKPVGSEQKPWWKLW